MARRRAAAMVLAVALAAVAPASVAVAHPGPGPLDYGWVSPPSGIGGTPAAQGRTVTLGNDLLSHGRADVWTPDLQALVSVTGRAPIEVRLTPHDPAAWQAPEGLLVSGNAYEVVLDGAVVEATTYLRPPHPVTHVARWDGQQWHVHPVMPGPDGEVRIPWQGSGPYVAAAHRLDGHSSAVAAMVHDPWRVLVFAAGLTALSLGLRRRRTAVGPTGTRTQDRREPEPR